MGYAMLLPPISRWCPSKQEKEKMATPHKEKSHQHTEPINLNEDQPAGMGTVVLSFDDMDKLAKAIAGHIAAPIPHACQFSAEDMANVKEMAGMFKATKDAAKTTGMRALQVMFWFLLIAAGAGIIAAIRNGLKP